MQRLLPVVTERSRPDSNPQGPDAFAGPVAEFIRTATAANAGTRCR